MPWLLPDGRRALTVSDDDVLRAFDLELSVCVWEAPLTPDEISCVSVDGAGRRVLVGGEDGSVRVFDADSLEPSAHFRPHTGRVAIVESACGALLSVSTEDATVVLIDPETGATQWCHELGIPDDTDGACLPALSPTGNRVAVPASGGRVAVLDLAVRHVVTQLEIAGQATSLCWSPDGRLLAITADDAALHCWDSADGSISTTRVEGIADPVVLAVATDGRAVIAPESGSDDIALRLLDARSGVVDIDLAAPPHGDLPLLSPVPGHDALAIVAYHDSAVVLWDLDARRVLTRWDVGCAWDRAIPVWRDWLVAAGQDGAAILLGPLSDALEA